MGELKVIHEFLTAQEPSTPNSCAVQGSTVFDFCKFMFEIPSGDVQGAGRHMSMDFSEEIWARDMKLGLITT